MAINITADPIIVTTTQGGALTQWSPTVPWQTGQRDTSLDQTFDCYDDDRLGNSDGGVLVVTLSILGTWINQNIDDISSTDTITLSILGDFVEGVVVDSSPIVVTLSFKDADVLTENFKKNFVKWSRVGSLIFTIDRDNIAGEMPLDWQGWVYAVKKLGNSAVAYGENGVSILTKAGKFYSLNTIYRVGLKSKHAVAGNDSAHFFIDNKGRLFSLGESLRKLDYSEYLSPMGNNLVMSYDDENDFIYICDGGLGYIYSVRDESLGSGPVNVTGISSQGGTLYVASPATITTPPFQICTDIYDFGTRKLKTVNSLEIGTNLTETLYSSIDYRNDKSSAFSQTLWWPVNEKGSIHRNCCAREFRFRFKTNNYEYFEMDYININGEIHTH